MDSTLLPKISVLLVVLNGEKHLPLILADLLKQDYPRGKREFLLIDSLSCDGTKGIMESFANDHPEEQVKILDNPGVILASGWNIALREVTGDALLRLDAHCRIPPDYLSACARWMKKGEKIVGGQVISIQPQGEGWAEIVYLVETSRFGAGIAPFRNPGPPRYVDTLAFAVYDRQVFEVVGPFNEKLGRTEDNDYHYRARKAGFRFFFSPEIKSYRFPRATLGGLLRQQIGNGYWLGLTLRVTPGAISLRHLLPGFFVLAIILAGLLYLGGNAFWLFILCGTYLASALIASLVSISHQEKTFNKQFLLMPFIFLLVHLSYGVTSIIGVTLGPIFSLKK
jgi:glycosyltransferase involved in cell wall biosynthesis